VTPGEFAAKWRGVETQERASAQSHFLDLCAMLGEPGPTDADPTGSWYAFEKGAEKLDGHDGFADVWKKDRFAWEYKGKRKDLKAAYIQLNNYRDALENPPLLVVSDMERIEVRTNFTNLSPVLYTVTLDALAGADPSEALRILRAVFAEPEALRPHLPRQELTEEAARRFAELAGALQSRGHDPEVVAHFLDKLLFCLFAEDTKLLPKGLLSRLADATRIRPTDFENGLRQLFETMASKGGMFGVEPIQWFNGGLFDTSDVLPLTPAEIRVLLDVGRLDWSQIEPAIFGTLFERGLDPAQRTQLGAHYTSRDDIWRLVEPVVIRPLRREFVAIQTRVTELTRQRQESGRRAKRSGVFGKEGPDREALRLFTAFLERLRTVRILDPACGSGNFLYIALQSLKDLELEAIQWGSLTLRLPQELPRVGPEAVLGIEINTYAAELARVTIWIGEIQWMLNHGFHYRSDPILSPLDSIATQDALLDLSDPANPQEAAWPPAEFIVGNPPFLGDKLLRGGLGNPYVDALNATFHGRLPAQSDLACYWHEKARAMIASGQVRRAGLLATQGIRGGANRRVLERINETGGIFFARSDGRWVLSGANVHISFVGQDNGSDTERELDGQPVAAINSDLTAGTDFTRARRLRENLGIGFLGSQKAGPFDISADTAKRLLASPNPDGRPNSDVVKKRATGQAVLQGRDLPWIIDFGSDMSRSEAALYEQPFEYVREHVQPTRAANPRRRYREWWWIHAEPRPGMRAAIATLNRFIATPTLSKHRIFVWLSAGVLPDHQLVVIARDDDYTFGALHSRVHELWARATGTQLREVESGFRYTPTTTFETFPFPRPTDEQGEAIAIAARRLVELRDGWLNPPDLGDEALASRTLTNLYNERPTWLANAHADLDRSVLDAYGWPPDLDDGSILERLLAQNLEREPA
jgi:type II restriction/modification system DNA methylase subunit YeeA